MKPRNLDPSRARAIARQVHAGQLDRRGEPLTEHVERVASVVPPEGRTVAYLHDVLERSATTIADLRGQGLTDAECSALRLLTRPPGESYETHVRRIARAKGDAGRLARTVKLADLEDHLRSKRGPGAPDYAWARTKILGSREPRLADPPRARRTTKAA